MAITEFTIGSPLSLDDISLALDYLNNKDNYEPELQYIRQKTTSKDNYVAGQQRKNFEVK